MGFTTADQYRRVDAHVPAAPAPDHMSEGVVVNIVPGFECPLSGYILTAEAIARKYCDRQGCVKHVRRDLVDGCRQVS